MAAVVGSRNEIEGYTGGCTGQRLAAVAGEKMPD